VAEVWLVDLARSAAALEGLEQEAPRLGARERAAILARKDAAVRQKRLSAHVALRVLLERALGTGVRGAELERPLGAKPRLPGGAGVEFSLAHGEEAALIGLSRGAAIGVDLERVRPLRIAKARRERILWAGVALLAAEPVEASAEEAFMRAWVRLEALAKARGDGLARTLSALGLRTAARSDVSQVAAGVAQHLAATGLRLHDLALAPGRVGAVALDRTLALPPLSPFPSEPGGIEELLRTRAAG
jgi:4'-phosphopantetheinyl transferase